MKARAYFCAQFKVQIARESGKIHTNSLSTHRFPLRISLKRNEDIFRGRVWVWQRRGKAVKNIWNTWMFPNWH